MARAAPVGGYPGKTLVKPYKDRRFLDQPRKSHLQGTFETGIDLESGGLTSRSFPTILRYKLFFERTRIVCSGGWTVKIFRGSWGLKNPSNSRGNPTRDKGGVCRSELPY